GAPVAQPPEDLAVAVVEDVRGTSGSDERARRTCRLTGHAAAQATSSSAGIVVTILSIGTPTSAARSQPCGCHSSCPVAWASESIENQQSQASGAWHHSHARG